MPLTTTLFGSEPLAVVVYLILLVLWDPCYRIGMPWWAAVVSFWGAIRYRFDGPTAEMVRRVNLLNVGFAVVQVPLFPFVADQPAPLLTIGGHVVAVTVVPVATAVLTRT